MAVYTHQLKHWPGFVWDHEKIGPGLAAVRYQQGRLLGRMEGMGLPFQAGVHLDTLTREVLSSSELDGQVLDAAGVRLSVTRALGMGKESPVLADPAIEGMVGIVVDATQNYAVPVTNERLFGWAAALLPLDHSGTLGVDGYRVGVSADATQGGAGLFQGAAGAGGGKKVHFQAPDSQRLEQEMTKLLRWFNRIGSLDPVIKAAITHLLFTTLHPFDKSNGRITRAMTEMQLTRADLGARRCYSLSARMRSERDAYHRILEHAALLLPDITEWLEWFITCLGHAIADAQGALAGGLQKSRFWEKHLSASINARQRAMLNRLLDGLEGPLTSSGWARMANCSQDTAGRDINELVELGILAKGVAGGRSTRYVLVGE